MSFKIAIVDDHALVREGMAETFADLADFELVAQGESADDAIRIASEHRPHLMLIDVNMPGGGVAAVAGIARIAPGIRTVMFSFRQDVEIVRACLAAGAVGYIVKGVSGPEMVAVARMVMKGDSYIDPDLLSALALEAEAKPRDLGAPS